VTDRCEFLPCTFLLSLILLLANHNKIAIRSLAVRSTRYQEGQAYAQHPSAQHTHSSPLSSPSSTPSLSLSIYLTLRHSLRLVFLSSFAGSTHSTSSFYTRTGTWLFTHYRQQSNSLSLNEIHIPKISTYPLSLYGLCPSVDLYNAVHCKSIAGQLFSYAYRIRLRT
jgi:hypothetical protein